MDSRFEEFPKHVVACQQFSRAQLEHGLFPMVRRMQRRLRGNSTHPMHGKGLVNLFYEESSRTRYFFRKAWTALGGYVDFETENARQFSSVAKGESLKHTMAVFAEADVIVLRHDKEGAAEEAAGYLDEMGSNARVINGGDGLTGQHPTQSFIDLFTMHERLNGIDGKQVAFVGDLQGNRAINSNAYNLAKFNDVTMHFISPADQPMHPGVLWHLQEKGVRHTTDQRLKDVIAEVDVIYVVRTKDLERRKQNLPSRVNDSESFILDAWMAGQAKPTAIFMHPMPINEGVKEIRSEVEKDNRCVVTREQLRNHLPVRMALFDLMFASDSSLRGTTALQSA